MSRRLVNKTANGGEAGLPIANPISCWYSIASKLHSIYFLLAMTIYYASKIFLQSYYCHHQRDYLFQFDRHLGPVYCNIRENKVGVAMDAKEIEETI